MYTIVFYCHFFLWSRRGCNKPKRDLCPYETDIHIVCHAGGSTLIGKEFWSITSVITMNMVLEWLINFLPRANIPLCACANNVLSLTSSLKIGLLTRQATRPVQSIVVRSIRRKLRSVRRFSSVRCFSSLSFGPPTSSSSSKMREIVHLQAGQCGNQIGAKVSWNRPTWLDAWLYVHR